MSDSPKLLTDAEIDHITASHEDGEPLPSMALMWPRIAATIGTLRDLIWQAAPHMPGAFLPIEERPAWHNRAAPYIDTLVGKPTRMAREMDKIQARKNGLADPTSPPAAPPPG